MRILPKIYELIHYLNVFKQSESKGKEDVGNCPLCGCVTLWRHGHYTRKADRESSPGQSLNPIPIQRFYCTTCKKTHSVLPECIPPRRWFLWSVQHAVLVAVLLGQSVWAVAEKSLPSRQTISRWCARFKAQFHLHKDALCDLSPELGRASCFTDFWSAFLKRERLSSAMYQCHAAGIAIP